MSVIGMRLKQARKKTGITQEKQGVLAGIEEMSASARMNQYERGLHIPNTGPAQSFRTRFYAAFCDLNTSGRNSRWRRVKESEALRTSPKNHPVFLQQCSFLGVE